MEETRLAIAVISIKGKILLLMEKFSSFWKTIEVSERRADVELVNKLIGRVRLDLGTMPVRWNLVANWVDIQTQVWEIFLYGDIEDLSIRENLTVASFTEQQFRLLADGKVVDPLQDRFIRFYFNQYLPKLADATPSLEEIIAAL